MLRFHRTLAAAFALLTMGFATDASAQASADRGDPSLILRSVDRDQRAGVLPERPATIEVANSAPQIGRQNIFVGAVRFEGAQHMDLAPLIKAAGPFIGRDLPPAELRKLLADVSDAARAQGFIFARSSIRAQSLAAGVLSVTMDEGTIDQVALIGSRSRAVREVLAPLVGKPGRRMEVERRLMLASDLSGITLGKVSYARVRGRGVLTVRLRERRVSASVAINNWGFAGSGPVRSESSLEVAGIFSHRDALELRHVGTPGHPGQLNFLFGRYATVLPRSGIELALYGSYGRTRPNSSTGGSFRKGASHDVGITASAPLIRSRKNSLWLTAGLDRFAVAQRVESELVRRDRVTSARLSLNGFTPLAGGRLRAGAGITRGLDFLGATKAADPLASRDGASPQFTLFEGWANWTGTVAGPISARAAVYAQLTTKPLLAIEQVSIGGRPFGRAFDYSERFGDRGVLGSFELRADLLSRRSGSVRSAQLYAFADGGRVSSLRSDFGAGSLISAGSGVRAVLAHGFRLEVEAGFPLNTARYASGDHSPRLRFSLSKSF